MERNYKSNLKTSCLIVLVALSMTTGYYACIGNNDEKKDTVKYDLPAPSLDTHRVKIDTFFSESALKDEITRNNILFEDIVYNQARLETGNFKSRVFKKYNNLFGFVGKNGYIKYNSWRASVIDYKAWQYDYYRGGDYYTFLKAIGYAEDSLYISKLRRM